MSDQETEKFWDEFAADYFQNQQESKLHFTTKVGDFLQTQKILPTKTLLDLGAGSGRFIRPLALLTEQLLEVDISKNMLIYGQKLADQAKLKNIRFIHQSWAELSHQTNQADVIFASMFSPVESSADLLALTQLARRWVILGQFTSRQSQLDNLIVEKIPLKPEDTIYNPELTQIRINNLNTLRIPYLTHTFTFSEVEMVTQQLLFADLKTRVDPTQETILRQIIEAIYGANGQLQDKVTYSYRLLYWQTNQVF